MYVAHTPTRHARGCRARRHAGASPRDCALRRTSSRDASRPRARCAKPARSSRMPESTQALVVAGDDEQSGGYLSQHDRAARSRHPHGRRHPAHRRRRAPRRSSAHRAGRALGLAREKQKFARESAVSMHIVTQFGFDPAAVSLWDRHLPEHDIQLPVYVGMAGPASLPKLIKYAMQCGVGASLRGRLRNMTAMRNVTGLATSPDEMLTGIVDRAGPGQPHRRSASVFVGRRARDAQAGCARWRMESSASIRRPGGSSWPCDCAFVAARSNSGPAVRRPNLPAGAIASGALELHDRPRTRR